MIKIIIFSLFMCILNTDAAEGPVCEGLACFTGKSAKTHCRTLKSNLTRSGFIVDESAMWTVCDALSQTNHFQNENPVLQTDIETILYTLKQASSTSAEGLATIFREADKQVREGTRILYAFGQCVPKIDIADEDIKKILIVFRMRASVIKSWRILSVVMKNKMKIGFRTH
ncbi:MAG: hypothetical protein OXC30_01075 [Alphaproteobacteria bacterium]|nr:hypothetical protein [Alphaproteobacteria bacterium]